MKNRAFVSHTLDDKISKDCISAVSDTSEHILKGGMAIQAYFNDKFGNKSNPLKRETSDIDTFSPKKLSYRQFKNSVSEDIQNDLLAKGYSTNVNKNKVAYEIEVFDNENSDKMLIHFDRYANGFHKVEKDNLESMKTIQIF